MGFEGTTITPQIRKLISEHHIGSLLLTAKNFKSMEPYPSPDFHVKQVVCCADGD